MRTLRISLTVAIAAFWLVMNGMLLRREMEYRSLDLYRQGVVDFLGQDLRRERWLGIYHEHRKIGYTGLVLTKSFEDEGILHEVEIDSLFMIDLSQFTIDLFGKIDLFGTGKRVRVRARGTVLLDHAMAPREAEIELTFDNSSIRLSGEHREDAFVVVFKTNGQRLLELPLPIEQFWPTDGFFPTLPVSGYEIGQSYEVPMFDPISGTRSMARVEVIESGTRMLNGLNVDCLVVKTRFRGVTYTSWVTPDGEVIRQEIPEPYNFVMKRETRREAVRGIPGVLINLPPERPADEESDSDER